MTRVLFFGASGFLGGFLQCALKASPDFEPIIANRSQWDITDRASLVGALRQNPADIVVNMAAISSTGASSQDVYSVNAQGQLNMLDALVETGFSGRHIFFSSSNVYGAARAAPLKEDTRPRPLNHYSCAKLLAEHYCEMYRPEVRTTILRPFSVIGLGQKQYFLMPKLARHFAEDQPRIELGNLDVCKDFVDARDFSAMFLAILRAEQAVDIANLCNGQTSSIRDILGIFQTISAHAPEVVVNSDFVRPKDILFQVGDPTLIKSLGYTRSFTIEQTVAWLYEGTRKGL